MNNKQKGLVPLLIVVLIALGVGGYLIYQKQPKSNSISTPSPQQATQPSPSPADKTADWKTYTNDLVGFQMKYPPDWSQVIIAYNRVAISPKVPQPFYPATTFTLTGVLIDVSDNSNNLLSKDYVLQNIIPQNDYTKKGKITSQLSNIDGVIVEGLINPQSGNPVGPVVYISKGSKIISLELNPSGISTARTIFDQMLSTFKFQ